MKHYRVIVPPDVPDIVEISGKPHRITDASFTQSESHNAQMIVYCTVTPVSDAPPFHAIVDDMIAQQSPDTKPCPDCGYEFPCECLPF